MHDVRDVLERARRLAPQPRGFDGLERRRDRKVRRGRVLSAVVALAMSGAVIGAGAFAMLRAEDSGRPGGVAAGAEAVPQPGPGEFYFLEIRRTLEDGNTVEKYWWAPDGSGRIQAESSTDAYGVPESGVWGPGETPDRPPFGGDLSGLSSDPEVLARQLQMRSASAGGSPQPDVTPGPGQAPETGGHWRAVTHLLEVPYVTPAQRAALYEVAKAIPGVEDLGPVTDPVGRAALGLRLDSEGTVQTLYFDRETRLYMGSRFTGGGSIMQEIVVAAGIAGGTDSAPDDDRLFFDRPTEPLPSEG